MKQSTVAEYIALRPISEGDEEFLYEVYASTRAWEMALTGWDQAEQEKFLRMQFSFQAQAYAQNYHHPDYQIILWQNSAAGRLYLDRRAQEIRIVDIALLPEYRDRGIGTYLFEKLQEEGLHQGLAVTIHVERFNRAKNLYERLGFRQIRQTDEVYQLMEWQPESVEASA
ncbi:MAG: GNAT family N-acetyltransferase [Proteobacteria bacterium]|nr:GNAT family N-acetyltransferase [Pseudomonadota bacterium]MBU1685714.1 GNAT family N-acetyltransferase [Pseudomonadota bacterium]